LSETGTVTGSVTKAETTETLMRTVPGTARGSLMVFWEAMCCAVYWTKDIRYRDRSGKIVKDHIHPI
jgi:hypothetical protein